MSENWASTSPLNTNFDLDESDLDLMSFFGEYDNVNHKRPAQCWDCVKNVTLKKNKKKHTYSINRLYNKYVFCCF